VCPNAARSELTGVANALGSASATRDGLVIRAWVKTDSMPLCPGGTISGMVQLNGTEGSAQDDP
jgi:hypothetical protein